MRKVSKSVRASFAPEIFLLNRRRFSSKDVTSFLVNPFPILPNHITIPTRRHTPQHILPYFPTMCKMAGSCPDMLFFYNGPVCGASAPDHMHLQAGQRGIIPIEKDWKNYDMNCEKLYPIDSDQEEEIENLLSLNSPCGIYYLKN